MKSGTMNPCGIQTRRQILSFQLLVLLTILTPLLWNIPSSRAQTELVDTDDTPLNSRVQAGVSVVSIQPSEMESPAVGEQFTIDVNITGGENVAGYQMTVTFDPTALSFVSIENADYLPVGAFVLAPTPDNDRVTFIATSGGASNGDGTLAKATFEVVKVKASTIGLVNVTLSDPDLNRINVTTEDGKITGGDAVLIGDVNGDGAVNIFDLVTVAGQFGETGENLLADVNGDGTVNIFDLVTVASHFGETL